MTYQRKQVMTRNTIWLRRVGLIAGIAGIIELIIWVLFHFEGGPSWIALIPSIIYFVPLLAGLLVSWKWPFIGGLSLIVMAVIIFIAFTALYFARPTVNPITELLMYVGQAFAALGLPYLLPGILFTLSAKQSSKNMRQTA